MTTAEITVVGNGEEGKFRMDVLTDEITDGESHIRRSQGSVLYRAIQAVAGVTIEPTDLPIFRASTLIPLLFLVAMTRSLNQSARHSVVHVEQTEKNDTYLGSSDSIRLFPVLHLSKWEQEKRAAYNRTLGIASRSSLFSIVAAYAANSMPL
jgi:hypothetical protein